MMNEPILIFLADDDEDDRMIFEEALSGISSSTSLVAAEDGDKLLLKLTTHERLPDIIFLDLNMPNKNGKETLRELKQSKSFSTIPVVIYSTSTNELDIEQTYNAGAVVYLEKPYSMGHMKNVLSSIITSNWSRKRRREEFFIQSKNMV
jgi:CheY-like chemotaxis protein